jgi:hypothetical protein
MGQAARQDLMITTRDEFEDALGRVLGYLAQPPEPGSAGDRDFSTLLSSLEAYRGGLSEDEAREETVRSAFKGLDQELASFRLRHADRPQAGAFSGFGFGRRLEDRS